MTKVQPLVRTRVYLTPDHISKCKVLADRYHTNRSEVIRVVLDHALDLVAKELRRLQRARSARAAEVLDPPRSGPEAPASPADRGDQLRQYAEALVALDVNRPEAELRLLLTTQAKVLQIPAADLEDAVDEVITMLPSAGDDDVESDDGVQRREPPA